jgi:flavin reductase (DIM6/NTAB) family NADH-FMN oxidoreductase RutF
MSSPAHLDSAATVERPVVAFREAMARVCTPVTIVTAMAGERPHGTTVSAFASLSLDPPMLMVSLDRNSDLLATIDETGWFGVNVLQRDHEDLARRFARKGADKFDGVLWQQRCGVPLIAGVSNWIACRVAERVPAADHVLLLGKVVDVVTRLAEPLVYHDRIFGTTIRLQP